MRFISAAALALLGLATACQGIISPALPAATQEGKDTFGCLLDGNVWLPNTTHTLDDILEADISGDGKIFGLKAEDNRTPTTFYLTAGDSTGLKPGTYPLRAGFSASYTSSVSTVAGQYHTLAADQGHLTITKVEPFTRTGTLLGQQHTVKGAIVSGTFEFTATNGSGETITVRDGRFDVNAYQ